MTLMASACRADDGQLSPHTGTSTAVESHPILKVDVPFVLVPVHVTTMIGRPLTKLVSSEFHLFDQGVEHAINTFTHDDAPISVGLLFDSSGSMRNKMQKSIEAAGSFLRTANDADEHFLIEVGTRARISVPFTGHSADIIQRISKIQPFGRTSLFDAIQLALNQMKNAKHTRKAIVIFSDGGDNCSRRNILEIQRALAESDVQVYAIGIFDQTSKAKPTKEEIKGPETLSALAELTGGTHLRADLTNLSEVSAQIGGELRNQYVLGYYPAVEVRNGKYHRIRVTVTPKEELPDLRITHRPGYSAASY